MNFHFSDKKADEAVRFIESLTLTGECLGQPFKLFPAHRKIVQDLYGNRDEQGFRQYRQAFITFARKNGKTQLAAALAIKALLADGEKSPQVYSAAVDREQAGILFKMMKSMILANPTLRKLCKIKESTKEIFVQFNNGYFKALSSDGESKHGLNPSCVIFDETHCWKNEELWNALTTGSDARKQPLFIIITTAGTEENSIWGRTYQYAKKVQDGIIQDPRYYTAIFEVPHDADWKDSSIWHLANPGLGVTITLDKLEDSFRKCENVPFEQAAFRRLKLNQFMSAESVWMDMSRWKASAGTVNPEELHGLTAYAGLDLSSKLDITALVLTIPVDRDYKVLPFFFMPENSIESHRKSDKVPYDIWAEEGHIIVTPGDIVDYEFVEYKLKELQEHFNIKELAFDKWNAGELTQKIEKLGITPIPFGQNFSAMTTPTKELMNLVMQKRIHHGNNPVLNFMCDCVTVASDAAENIKFVKPDRNRSSKRIDGMVALVMGLDRAIRHGFGENNKTSVYETTELFTL